MGELLTFLSSGDIVVIDNIILNYICLFKSNDDNVFWIEKHNSMQTHVTNVLIIIIVFLPNWDQSSSDWVKLLVEIIMTVCIRYDTLIVYYCDHSIFLIIAVICYYVKFLQFK